MTSDQQIRFSWGPERLESGTRFRLWAPSQESVALELRGERRPMEKTAEGWFTLDAPDAAPGDDYAFVLADGLRVPDPASRAQSGTVHDPSRLTDPASYRWQHDDWRGRPWHEAVIYELHTGTFTPEGTYRAAIEKLPHLKALGVTIVEIMPVAQHMGDRGWGYDGVLLYAPHRAYGAPGDLKALVDAAHGLGLSVILDVVYNHFGPDGNYLHAYAPEFFDPGRDTPWGAAIDYAKPPVRRFFLDNALYWLGKFRFDGLRLDAVDNVRDPKSDPEILVEIAEEIRRRFPGRHIHLTTEDNRNVTHLHERGAEGAITRHSGEWNDDFHNVAHVIATGEGEGYYADFTDDPAGKLARALAEGFVYQGEEPPSEPGTERGVPSAHLPPTAFVDFLQNHDQTGNRAFGERLIALTEPGLLRVLSAIHLLSPHIPLIFMGEEWGETRPFAFFTDFDGELAEIVREGRRKEFRHFAAFEDPERRAKIPDPNAETTFEASKIDWNAPETREGRAWLEHTKRLLALRAERIVPHLENAPGHAGRVLAAGENVVAVEWRLDGIVLRMRANLGEREAEAPEIGGDLLHSENGAAASGPLPGPSVAVTRETV